MSRINQTCNILVLAFLIAQVVSVDRGNFKTCEQSGFCKRHRRMTPNESPYRVIPENIVVSSSSVTLQLLNTKTGVLLRADIYALEDNTVRVKINEAHPVKQRYEPPVGDVLVKEPTLLGITLVSKDQTQATLAFKDNKIVIQFEPFRIELLANDEPVIVANIRGLLKFEELREKPRPAVDDNKDEKKEDGGDTAAAAEEKKDEADKKEEAPPTNTEEEPDLWEESFKTHQDSKPNGPESVGMDFSFLGYEHVYGIPEHADSLALKTTTSTDPYRLYNLDVFEYELFNPMALYGSVPVIIAHNEKRTVGMFWNNAAETWIDVNSNVADKNMFSKLVDLWKRDADIPQIDTHWFSESGVIDVFFMLGPRPNDVFRQYAALTGTTPLPPLFAIGYHQSRWNYNDEQDVANVDANFDQNNIPLDVIWLDIEHTDGKRYFTFDVSRFPHSEDMLRNLSAKGRKMVGTIDPHLKRDENYHLYSEANTAGYFVLNSAGAEYEGWCWPGSSAWLDFTNPEVRDYWAKKFLPEEYKGSTLDLFTWNDMNEPSVFNGPEVTMYKDAKHFGGWEHRDVHNIYGLYVHRSSVEGQLLRSSNQHRPFVLSRAFFAGSQRYGAVWTGDNTAEWSHLKISVPMVLSLNLVGITLSGADVGGFFKNPDNELLSRWYQAAAFQPFFRAHAHLDTKRREPWLLPDEHKNAIAAAIRIRYKLLPYWYTLFFKSEKDGAPVLRPLWVEFPQDKNTFAIDNEHLVGSAILVHPVTDSGASGVNVYMPGPIEIWYDAETFVPYPGGKQVYVPVNLDKIPYFFRGGHIVPTRERVRRSSILAFNDPYTLIVALDKQGSARGELYHDDFHSFKYQSGYYVHREFVWQKNSLTSRNLNTKQSFTTNAWIERIIVVGLPRQPSSITLNTAGSPTTNLEFKYDTKTQKLTIRKPGVKITADFSVMLK